MPRVPWMVLPLLLLALGACRRDPTIHPTGTLKITLVPEWEGEPFHRFTEYRNFMDYRTTVEMLKMYFGDVRLLAGEDTLPVKDVELFDLGDGAVSAQWTVPPGRWERLRAALGVPAELNYADPANYPAGHPLDVGNGTYWTWATGYRYVVFEGRYDPDPASTAQLITAYAIHPGMEPSYIEFELAPAGGIPVVGGATTELTVRVAVDRFFHSDEHTIDLATENTAHGTNPPLQWKLVNNVVSSFTVE